MKWWLVFALGGLGATARFAFMGLFPASAGPWGTLSVNVLGCLVAGALFALFEDGQLPPAFRIGLMAGLLGGFTTFSAFGVDVIQLLGTRPWLAGCYAVASVALGVFAAASGVLLARQLF